MLIKQLKLSILAGRLIESVTSMYLSQMFTKNCELLKLFHLVTLICIIVCDYFQEGTFNLCEHLQW